MSPARRLWAYLLRYRGRYAVGILFLIAATGVSLCIPWTIKNAIDAIRHEGGASLPRYVGIILLLAAANGVARMGSRFAMLGAGQWVERDIRDDLFAHLLTMPPAFYHAHRVGDLMSRASSDVSAVRQLAGFGTVMMSGTTLAFVGTLTAMWLIDPWLTVYALTPFPLLVLIAKRFIHQVAMRSTEVQEQLGVLSAKIQENLGGIAVVRAYTVEAREIADFGRLNDEYLRRSLRLARVQALSVPLMGLVSGIGGLIVLWLGGKAVVDQRITLGAFVAFNAYLAHLAWPTIALGWTLSSVKRGLASMQRIAEILETPAPADEVGAEAAEAPLLPAGPIEFRDLTFSYGDRGPVLEGVSFRVPQGGLVAVVGPTGSGKSTLGLLLCRLFEPPRGTVFVGGVDVAPRVPAPAAAVGRVCAAGGLPVFPLAPRQCAASPAPPARSTSAGRRRRPDSARRSSRSPTGGTRWSASAASRSRAASASGRRWRGRSRGRHRTSSWMTCSPRWTPPRNGRSSARCGRR